MPDELTGCTEKMNGSARERPAPTPRSYGRRPLLRAALGLAGTAVLAACAANGTGTAATDGSSPAGGGTAPTATGVGSAATGARPAPTTAAAAAGMRPPATARATATGSPAAGGKIPAPRPGVPDLYIEPIPPFRSVAAVPGRGGKVTTYQITYFPPIPPLGENRYLQELNQRLGATLEPTLTPAASYAEKLGAITAGGDLPDLTLIDLRSAPDQAKVIQQGAYTDLTPSLTGGARQEYPNLAPFPEQLWENAAIKGKVYGVPRPRYLSGNTLLWRQDWAEKLGKGRIANADDFRQVTTACTTQDPDGNGAADTFGLGSNAGDFALSFINYMFRVPNQWRLQDGKLTYYLETDEFRQALTFARHLYENKGYHPDAATQSVAQGNDALKAGRIGGMINAWYSLLGIEEDVQKVSPQARLVALIPPGHDGGQATVWNNSGYFGFVAIPAKAGRDRERVRELLRILDYFAAPAGSEERTFLNSGVEGVHHEVRPGGSRAQTERGKQEMGDLKALMEPPPVFVYAPSDRYPDNPGRGKRLQQTAADLLAIGIDNPALTAFSPTNAQRAGELNTLSNDRVGAIIQGREPLGALDTLIRDWKSRGGDQIRREYEEDLTAQ